MNSETGTCIIERDAVESFNDISTKKIKHCFELEPHYGCTGVTRPTITTDEVDDEGNNVNEE